MKYLYQMCLYGEITLKEAVTLYSVFEALKTFALNFIYFTITMSIGVDLNHLLPLDSMYCVYICYITSAVHSIPPQRRNN